MSNLNRKGPEEQGSMTGRKMGKCTGKHFDEGQLAIGMGMRRKSQGNNSEIAGGRKGGFGRKNGNNFQNKGERMGRLSLAGCGKGFRRKAEAENL